MHHVRDPGALPDVRRGPGAGQDDGGGDRLHEPEGRLCGIHPESSGDAGVQPSGEGGAGGHGGGVRYTAKGLFQSPADTIKRGKESGERDGRSCGLILQGRSF